MRKNIKKFYQKTKKQISRIIEVENAIGEEKSTAEILVQNKIDYMPKVSVVMPVYNVEEYLREALDGVRNQSLKEIEIICVDDGSTDNSLEILKEYAQKDNRITVIRQNNLHAGVARNAGLAVARGEYLSFLDSDDIFEPTLLEETYKLAQKEESEIVFYQYTRYNNETKEKETVGGINRRFSDDVVYTVSTEDLKENLFTTCNPMPWNKLIKRDFVVKENLHYQNLPASNDVCFSLTTIACAKKITLYYKSLVCYRYNRSNSLKNTRDKNPLNFYEAYKGIYNTLQEKGLYEKYKKTFLTSLISSSLWTMNNTEKARDKVKNFIKEEIIPKFIQNNEEEIDGGLLYRLNRVYYPDIIVSLTTYPGRINTVHQTIETLLNQSLKADKVILWLAEEQFENKEDDLPKELLDLKEKGLTIDWYHDIKSYKKLIPALKKYPEAIIVTADDDLFYHKDLLKRLYDSYLENPECIHCHRITRLYKLNGVMKIVSRLYYLDETGNYFEKLCLPNAFNKLSSGAGTLFPPHCFYKDVEDEDKFMSLAPTSDDLWFYLMGLLNGYKVKVVKNNIYQLSYVPGTQEEGLFLINDGYRHKIFFEHLNNILHQYPKLKEKFESDNEANDKILSEVFAKAAQERARNMEQWWYRVKKTKLDLENPQTFNEKIQWLKLYDSTPIKTRLADKYLVRDWVKEKIGGEYLIPLLGVYDKFEDINFKKLPNQFVIKCNHGCGYNIIVKDKSQLDLEEVKAKLDKWMNENFAFHVGYELQYRDIEPKIIIEKFIENEGTNDLYDYKFWCFKGKVKYIQFLSERNLDGLKMAFYDTKWNKQNFVYDHPLDTKTIEKPDNLDLMISLAENLAKNFNYARVDLYRLNNGKIYFGEMTFTSASGTCGWSDAKINKYLGSLIELPKLAYDIDTGKYYKAPRRSALKTGLLFPYYFSKRIVQKITSSGEQIEAIRQNLQRMRVDIKNIGDENNALEIAAPGANVLEAPWMRNAQGGGQIVESSQVKQKMSIKIVKDGKLQFVFRGQDRRNGKGIRKQIWIDYNSIKINGKEILKEPVQAWHDEPYRYEMEVKDGQTIDITIKQTPHQYDRNSLKWIIKLFYPNLRDLDKVSKIVHRKFDRRRTLSYKLFHQKETQNHKKIYVCGIQVCNKKINKKNVSKTSQNIEKPKNVSVEKTSEEMILQMSAKIEKELAEMNKKINALQAEIDNLKNLQTQKNELLKNIEMKTAKIRLKEKHFTDNENVEIKRDLLA